MKPIRLAVAAAAVAALAVPAAAAAHPSVYESDARTGNPPVAQLRYVVANHGFNYVLRESNGIDNGEGHGVMDYKFMPNPWRGGLTTAQLLDQGDTDLQVHATCWDADATPNGDPVEQLWSTGAIAGWQDTTAPIEPFYNYVPFQTASAGLEDEPASWLDDVQTLTGVNLSAPGADPAAQCTSIGGTLIAADATQSTIPSFNSGLIAHTAEPLEEEITALEKTAASADSAAKAATARALAAETALGGERTTVSVELAGTRMAARRGVAVELSGPPSREVTVELTLPSSRSKALGLRRNLAGAAVTTLDADGNGATTVEVFKTVQRALRRSGSNVKISVNAFLSDRDGTATATLTR
jgi:hypothetical protein